MGLHKTSSVPLTIGQRRVIKQHGGNHNLTIISGGHMAYHHFSFNGRGNYFVKAYDKSLFTDKYRRRDSKSYLKKEAATYKLLKSQGFNEIPDYFKWRSNLLILREISEVDGWYWRLPVNISLREKYMADIFESLDRLSSVKLPKQNKHINNALDTFYNEGWGLYDDKKLRLILNKNAYKWREKLHPESMKATAKLLVELPNLRTSTDNMSRNSFSHHDARQSNIAWHPEKGVVIVDWSWSGMGLKNADHTMFLIDILKSEANLNQKHLELVNKDYARLVLGWLLSRSGEPHREGNETVRFHQFASALTAYRLLNLLK